MIPKEDFIQTDVRQKRTRLTAAGILIVVVIISLGAIMLMNAGKTLADNQQPVAVATSVPDLPTVTATQTLFPTASAVQAPDATATQIPVICPSNPADWTITLEPGLKGQIGKVDPPCVADEVLADYEEAIAWILDTQDHDPEDAFLYFVGTVAWPAAQAMRDYLVSLQEQGQYYHVELDNKGRTYYTYNFSPDENQVHVVDRRPNGGTIQYFDLATGELLEEEPMPPHVMIYTMVFDSDGVWKIGNTKQHLLGEDGNDELYREVIEELQ